MSLEMGDDLRRKSIAEFLKFALPYPENSRQGLLC